jgi:UDP-glucose 4-epimerase
MEQTEIAVLVTGAGGYIGSETVAQLAALDPPLKAIVASDIREVPADKRVDGVTYIEGDVRDAKLEETLREHGITCVVHLASIVTPGKDSNRDFEYSVDVLGTQNVVECCLKADVGQLIVTSSGAAYGYYADNPQPLHEDDAIRGNPEFAYSDHKRLVEEMLARYRESNPELKQLIFRPGTVLGAHTANQITKLFDGKRIMGLKGADSPFVFIWDQDVVACIVKGILEEREGIYNLAGDGTLSLREIAAILGKPYRALPPGLVAFALGVLKPLGLTQYGPEQVNFLRYRPVLANDQLKAEFGYTPQKTTREVFAYYLEQRGAAVGATR